MAGGIDGMVRRALYPAVSKLVAHATLVEGPLAGAAEPFRCLFVDNSSFGEELMGRMYAEPPRVLSKRRIWIPSLRRMLSRQPDLCDLVVAVLPRAYEPLFKGLYDFRTTEGIRQVIDTSGTWDDMRAAFSKKKRQISNGFEQKYGLDFRMSGELADFDHFYHRMFVPHVARRYGELASIDDYGEMKSFFERGALLFVTKGGLDVAGALCLLEDGMLKFRRTGVLDGDETHVEGGAQTALYYFQLRYANEHGIRAVDTMLSSPFLNDGVFRHKREWGAAALPDDGAHTWVYLFRGSSSEPMARFLENNPMVIYSSEGLKGLLGSCSEVSAADKAVNDLVRRFRCPGLASFLVMTPTSVFEKALS